jgi:hypothetical protein
VVDPTNVGIGRDPTALQRISRRTGLQIVMGAGYYLEPSHPGEVTAMSVEEIAQAVARDCGAFDERPETCAGLIGEIGISKDFTAAEEKVLRGAARASEISGVPLSIHLPGWERLAHRVLDVIEAEGGDLSHTVLCHMNPSLHDKSYQRTLADRGAFLEYDMIGMDYFYADQQVAVALRRGECDRRPFPDRRRLSELDPAVPGRVPENDADPSWRLRLRLYPQALRAAAETSRHRPGNHRSHDDRESVPRILGQTPGAQLTGHRTDDRVGETANGKDAQNPAGG